jgi:23S rRNA (uracil-5-)-methyltransferase RumA
MLTPKLFRRQIIDATIAGEAVNPLCPHAPPDGMCGGCTFQDRSYATQIAAKQIALRGLWAADLTSGTLDAVEVIGSPNPFEYRTRMDYVCSKDRFGLRRSGKFNFIIDLDQCHLIPPSAFAAARGVHEYATSLGLPDYNLRSHEGFLRYVVVRRSPDDRFLLAVVTSAPDSDGVYEQMLEEVAAEALADPAVLGVHWLVNDSVSDVSFGTLRRHWGVATLPMRVGRHTLQIGPNTFFQNNVHLLMPLLDDIAGLISGQQRLADSAFTDTVINPAIRSALPSVADLYGGVGTIALHVADLAQTIVTVESVDESAELAKQNSIANGRTNVVSVQAETLAYLREQAIGRFDVIIADPPRTGLGREVCRELLRLRPERIIYVSCNPLSQIEDTRALAPGYRVTELRGYDMFPQTPHLESLALLEMR